ncbi:hypothetical protein TrVFT333_000537 [Trichoderma virens FT-333]|nr:hypothetical protein TrVFT333_000537 [Trichoderma virens FT-333]
MLDHKHADLPNPPNDPNTYTLGSINGHNIAIACLPKGKIGTSSAATVATWMVGAFPSIKVGLMVGIGGGIPPKVRLGDVVVSTPIGQFPGVVQWDIDILFRSDYGHVSKDTNYDNASDIDDYDEEESCELCDKSQILKKKPREMRVHYGLIASGNQVIKDATLRNKLTKDLDGHILCIEMEAAEHAAAVAAAFAKELLGYVQTSEVEREPPARNSLREVLDAISAVGENTAYTRTKLDKIEDIKILDWLTPTGYGLQQSDYFQRRQPGTGRWLLDSETFQNWLATSHQTLFCPGMPGAGKTILTSIVVNHLISEFRQGDVGIAYIYCNFRQHDEQTTSGLLASILKQLAETQPLLAASVKDLYNGHDIRRTRPSADEFYNTLQSIIASYSRIFVIVDALDECQTSNNCLFQFLSKLFDLQIHGGINIFATSRPIPEICQKFKESMMIEISAQDDDVRGYLDGQISQSGYNILDICREDIKNKITKAVGGMFLLAQLYFGVIKYKRTPKKIKDVLKDLPTGHNAYDHAYEEAMKRIMSHDPDTVELAMLVLSWITCAKRPLKILELQHALAVEAKKYRIDDENLLPIGDMISVCSGLAAVDEERGIIRLIHYTTHEYLGRTQKRWFPWAESAITRICVTYLLLDDFQTGPCQTNCVSTFGPCAESCAYGERLRLFPLYHYAANHWGHHARRCSKLDEEVMNFLNRNANVEASSQALMRRWPTCLYADVPRRVTGLHLASYFGVSEAVNAILQCNLSADVKDSHAATPLQYAVMNGHEDIVKLLLATGQVDPDSCDKRGGTPILYAAKNGHESVVNLLLETGKINPDSSGEYGGMLLLDAVENGHGDVVKLLLAAGKVNPHYEDEYGETPFLCAVQTGHTNIIRLLLTKSEVNPGFSDKYLKTALSYAAEKGYRDIVELLLKTGEAAPYFADSKNRTPLSYAAEKGYRDIVELLLTTGVNPDDKDIYDKTPLLYATEKGYKDIVELLLTIGKATPYVSDNNDRTPLSYAAGNGHEDIVKLLLAIDEVNPVDRRFCEIPYLDEVPGHENTVRKLPSTSTNIVDLDGWSPLTHAVFHQRESIVKLLLAKDITLVNLADIYGRTPLSYAAQRGYKRSTKLILATGEVDKNKLNDIFNWTPLHYAASNGYIDIVKIFLTINIPVGSTYGYEHEVCDSTPGHKSLKRLVKRHIRAKGHFSTQLKHRKGKIMLTPRPRRRVQRSSDIRSLKSMHDGSMKEAHIPATGHFF